METATTEVQKKTDETIGGWLSGKKNQFAMALPKHIKPDRFLRIALTAFSKTPKLRDCTKESLLSCLIDCSQLGIEPDGRKAHLIPYGNVCTLIIDYKGLVDLARRSGEVAYIHADVVCEKDVFEYAFGSGAFLRHVPALKDRGPATQVYSFVKLKDGSEDFCVMNKEEIEAVRGRSKASKNGPWVTDWNEMAKKTAFRRHSKWLPLSSEFQEAVEKDFDTPTDLLENFGAKPNDIEMPRARTVIPTAPTAQAVPQDEPASPAQRKNLAGLMGQAELAGSDILDFLSKHCADPDKPTVPEVQACLQELAAIIDGKSNKK